MSENPQRAASAASDDVDPTLRDLLNDLFAELKKPVKEISKKFCDDRLAQIMRFLALSQITKTPISDATWTAVPAEFRVNVMHTLLLGLQLSIKRLP